MAPVTRRRVLGTFGAAVGGVFAGCGADAADTPTTDADVLVGPDGTNTFDPEAVTIAVGETLTWAFANPGHNVSAVPEHAPQVSLPADAEPFASYGVDGSPNETEPAGETYEHTFETAGEFTYVCIPHVRQGMIGVVTVEK